MSESLSELDLRMLSGALSLGRDAEGSCYPNPAVGCIIAVGAEVIGFAATGAGGVPHAETRAIAMVKEKFGEKSSRGEASLRAASLYVTLEPCGHSGKTAPCSEAIIAAGIGRVVYGLRDANPRTNGKGRGKGNGSGSEHLRAAGVVVVGLDVGLDVGIDSDTSHASPASHASGASELAAEIASFFAPHCKRVTRGLPFCTLKLAITLDGKISSSHPQEFYNSFTEQRTDERTLISSPAAHPFRDDLLRRTDAIMIGARTMRSDDPRLLMRGYDEDVATASSEREHDSERERVFAPIRVLVDGRLTLGLDSRLFRTLERAPLWIITRQGEILSDKGKAISNSGVRFIAASASLLQGGGVSLSLREALGSLADAGIASLLCEGGARLGQSLLSAGLVDRLVLFCASSTIGSRGLSMLEGRASDDITREFIIESELRLGDGGKEGGKEGGKDGICDRIITLRPREVASEVANEITREVASDV